jgi:hypothetical protein
MKFRIIEVPRFENWSGEYEMTFSVQQKVWFFWKNVYTGLTDARSAEKLLERKLRIASVHKNKPNGKIVKEIEA